MKGAKSNLDYSLKQALHNTRWGRRKKLLANILPIVEDMNTAELERLHYILTGEFLDEDN